jgi:hypothetical protein
MTDEKVRKENIERYMAILSTRLDISKDITNCNKLILRSLGHKNAMFVLNGRDGVRPLLDTIIQGYYNLIKTKNEEEKKLHIRQLQINVNSLIKSSMQKSQTINKNLDEIKKRLNGKKSNRIALSVIEGLEAISQTLYEKLKEYDIETIEDFDILIRKFVTIRNIMRSERYELRYLGPFYDSLDNNLENAFRYLIECNKLKEISDKIDVMVRSIQRV